MKPCQRFSRSSKADQRASILLAVLIAGVVLMLIVAAIIQTISPAYRTTFESASWSESLHAAEGGVNLAISSIQASAPDPTANTWTGWTNTSGSPNGPWTYNALAADSLALAHTGEGNTNSTLVSLSVDVYTRNGNVDVDPNGLPWYRIHAVGCSEVPGNQGALLDKRDAELRRMRVSTDVTHPVAGVKRGVEVIVRPVSLLNNAIWSVAGLSFGNSHNWVVDSFNSNAGSYGTSPNTMDANVATNGTFVDLNSATVYGTVRTQGGDNHATYYGATDASGNRITSGYYENVGGANYILTGPTTANPSGVSNVTGLITDDFNQLPTPVMMPAWALPGSSVILAIPGGTATNPTCVAGASAATPAYYALRQGINGLTISTPSGFPTGQKAYVNIAIDGDIAGRNITIPANVVAKLYVNGSVNFGSGNSTIGSSVAANLQIYGVQGVTMVNGVPTYTGTGQGPSFSMGGNQTFIGTFYGPQYDVQFSGTCAVFGSIAGNSFNINGGGHAAFHYDDALANSGGVSAFEIASYVEDNRIQP